MDAKPILIVDDSYNILTTVSKALETLGLPVETAAYAEEALLRMERSEYAVVLLDLELWGKSGLDMLREMRARQSTVPVVIITAYGNDENMSEARRLGVADFVVKPFSPKEIRERVAKALDRAH